MSDTEWYVVAEDGAEKGPLSGEQLKALARKGEIVSETRVRRGDLRMPVPARDVAGLIPEDAPPPEPEELAGVAAQDSAPTRHVVDEPSEPVEPVRAKAPRITAALTAACLSVFSLMFVAGGLLVSETPVGIALHEAADAADAAQIAATGTADSTASAIVIGTLIGVTLLTPLLFVIWLYKTYGVVGALGDRRRHGSLAPLWAWFVPILSLVILVRILNDVRASAGAPSGFLVTNWWLGLFAIGAVSAAVGTETPQATAVPSMIMAGYVALVAVMVHDTTKAQAVKIRSHNGRAG